MPPSKHSGSSMSAHKDSDQIPSDQNYTLGEYSFRVERTSVPGSTNDKIEAICTDKDGKNARKSIQVSSSTQIEGWYVEANETEATVYVICKAQQIEDIRAVRVVCNIPTDKQDGYRGDTILGKDQYGFDCTMHKDLAGITWLTKYDGHMYAAQESGDGRINLASNLYPPNDYGDYTGWMRTGSAGDYVSQSVFLVHDGWKDVWSLVPESITNPNGVSIEGLTPYDPDAPATEETKMVGRFAIKIKDAGGVGPGSDWTDPGDYDEDWEEGDPTYTLYVEVTGALSGRHNDPIEDPSYSYIPADKDTVKDYGCGGDGGHGGGGGAGASTVVVHKFATNQANSKEVTAIARRHGYGSGGGKGGTGGDGCILVYY